MAEPAETQMVRLRDVASFIRGVTFKPADVEEPSDSNVDCMRTKNVQAELDRRDVWSVPVGILKRPDQLLKAGDLLVSSANSWNLVGKACWIPELERRTTFGGFVSVLRPEKADARYLFRWFTSDKVQKTMRSFGNQTTNISNLDLKRASNLLLPLPSLDEQRRIAAILDKADELRTKRHQALAHLDTLTQSIFHSMFQVGGAADAELGAHLTFVTSGGRGWAKYYSSSDSDSRFVRSLDVQRNYISAESPVFVRAPDNAEANRTRLKTDDVLLTITGSLIGRAAAVLSPLAGSYISQHVAILRPDTRKISPTYLSHFLNLKNGGQRLIESMQYGQTKPGLNFDQIRKFVLPVPSLELQQSFATRVAAVERLKESHRKHLAELDALFASLQDRAFKGEL